MCRRSSVHQAMSLGGERARRTPAPALLAAVALCLASSWRSAVSVGLTPLSPDEVLEAERGTGEGAAVLLARLKRVAGDFTKDQSAVEVIEVLRGKARVGDEIATSTPIGSSRSRVGQLYLFIGDVQNPDFRGDSWFILIERTTLEHARAVVKRAMEIQRLVPQKDRLRRRQALIDELKRSSTARATAWFVIFSTWIRSSRPWEIDRSPELAEVLRRVVEAELTDPRPIPDELCTPGFDVLLLFGQPGSPSPPLPLLLRCLDPKGGLLGHAAAPLLTKTTGTDRKLAIERMRAVVRDEQYPKALTGSVLKALGDMKATEALPEVRAVLGKDVPDHITYAALVALRGIDEAEGEARLVAWMRGQRNFWWARDSGLAAEAAARFKGPELVPYLVEALNGLKLIGSGNPVILEWLQSITALKSEDPAAFKTWWRSRFPGRVWPIRQLRVREDTRLVEFILVEDEEPRSHSRQ